MTTTRPQLYSLDELDARLLRQLRQLGERLFARTQVSGDQLWFHNPSRKDPNLTSASIKLRDGVWKDFSTGQAGRGGLKLIAEFATGGDYKAAILWAKDFLGLTDRSPDPAVARAIAADNAAREAADAAKAEGRRATAFKLWCDGRPLDGKDPASLYLKNRGIDVTKLTGGVPRALRFHPAVYATPENATFPAMLACMSREGLKHGFAAVHRTYLGEFRGRWVKAWGGVRAKRILGAYAGASIRLLRGDTGKALANAPEGEWIQLGEGIENMLSAALAQPEIRTLAAGSLSNLSNVLLPPQIAGAWLIADNDEKPETIAQFNREKDRLATRLELMIVRAQGVKDFNAALQGAGK
jgi:hypothetical protein